MKIAIGSDHAGYAFKNAIGELLLELGHEFIDCGPMTADRVDYPDYALKVAQLVSQKEVTYGMLVCGTGIGVAITANKVKGVRAATCITPDMAHLARAHNDANILCLGERLVSLYEVKDIVRIFLSTAFEAGRHSPRVAKIHDLTGL